jgi:prevent-host-death family protein
VTIPATTVHRKFGELIRRVYSGKEHFIIEKDGLPVAAIIPIGEYEAMSETDQNRTEALRLLDQMVKENGLRAEAMNLTEEDLMRDLKETRRQLHQERYGAK